MALYPRARQRLIPPGANDPRIKARIGILHVDAGNASSLYEYFKNRSGGIESHFHIPKVGKTEQYRDTSYEADANYKAGPFAISVETQGLGAGKWNDHQLDEIKQLMLWAREVHGIPLRVVGSWNDSKGGWGYHTLFGAPSMWTPNNKSCPGSERKVQFHKVLVPWMNSQKDDGDMTPADRKLLEDTSEGVARLEKAVRALRIGSRARDAKLLKAAGIADDKIDKILTEVNE